MDPTLVAFGMIMAGAIAAIVIPFVIKAKETGDSFNLSYIYGLLLSLIIAAFAILPTEPVPMEFKPLFALFLAGAGLQTVANKVNTIRIKKADN
jgi:hypothetical protein